MSIAIRIYMHVRGGSIGFSEGGANPNSYSVSLEHARVWTFNVAKNFNAFSCQCIAS